MVSIHASVKDATDLEVASFNKQNVSIHASVKDATRMDSNWQNQRGRFNPRICKRCDISLPVSLAVKSRRFNPRICKRCDNISLH